LHHSAFHIHHFFAIGRFALIQRRAKRSSGPEGVTAVASSVFDEA
jgi:hypothetical protein